MNFKGFIEVSGAPLNSEGWTKIPYAVRHSQKVKIKKKKRMEIWGEMNFYEPKEGEEPTKDTREGIVREKRQARIESWKPKT